MATQKQAISPNLIEKQPEIASTSAIVFDSAENKYSYSPYELRQKINYLLSKHRKAVEKFFIAKVSTSDLFNFIWDNSPFDAIKEAAAYEWKERVEWEWIYYKEDNHPRYDARLLSPGILRLFEKAPESPLAKYMGKQQGYGSAYSASRESNIYPDVQVNQPENMASIDSPVPTMELPETPKKPPISDVLQRTPFHVKFDPHMIRATQILNKVRPDYSETALVRLWSIIRHLDMMKRYEAGKDAENHVDLDELRAFLKEAGLYTKSSFWRWLHDGQEAGYWTLSLEHNRVHHKGYRAVAAMLTDALPDELLPMFMGNQAMGGRMVWADCRGSVQEFRGNVLGAWIAQREKNDGNGVTIKNRDVAGMWNISIRTVQNWRARVDQPKRENFSKPEDSQDAKQRPNTYYSSDDTQKHSHRGQSRKVRSLTNLQMTQRGFSPDSYVLFGEAKPIKRFFTDSKKLSATERIQSYRERHIVDGSQFAKIKDYGSHALWLEIAS